MDPIDYTSKFQNPLSSFNAGLQLGGSMLDQQAKRAQLDAAQAAQEAEAKRQAEIDALMAKLQGPDAGFNDYMKASMFLPKDQAEAMQKAATAMKSEERTAALTDTSQLFSAFRGGNKDVAIGLLRQHSDAERAAGNTKGADYANMLADMAEKDDVGAKAVENLLGYQLAALPGGKDAFDAIGRLETERRTATEFPTLQKQKEAELAKATTDAEKAAIETKYSERMQQATLDKMAAETAKLNAEAFRLKLENERPQGTEIDESARKLMNASTEEAMRAETLSAQAQNLAIALDKARPPSGWGARASEAAKKALGGEDKFTALKQEYVRLRNTEALRNLPPGAASDKDVEIALAAFPDDTSNPELISSFLRGMAKLQSYNAAVNKAKAEWTNINGSLGPARSDFTAGGKIIKVGTNFWDFTASIAIPNVVGGTTSKPAATTPAATPAPAATTPAPTTATVEVDY